jgi:hypothetical protein
LRSPVHLLITVVGLVVIGAGVGIVLPKVNGSKSAAASSSITVTVSPNGIGGTVLPGTTVLPTSLPTRLTSPLASPTTAPPAPEALTAADKWAAAYANHPEGMTVDQWLDGLRPYTTDEFLPEMKSVDLKNVAIDRITGKAAATRSFTTSVETEVDTNAGRLAIIVIATPDGWRVSAYTKAG